jgi:predicted RecA/RadA family phage recombinase
MKNFLEDGETVVVTAPETVDAGEFIKVDELYGVAPVAAASGDPVVLQRCGVFRLPKVTGTAWTQGQKLFWDSSAKKFTHLTTKTPVKAVAFAAAGSSDATGAVLIGAGDNMKMASGVVALDGSGATPTVTGLTAVLGGVATLEKATSPGVGTAVLTVNPNGASLDIYPWKVTATNDATLVASTGTENVHWIAWGY